MNRTSTFWTGFLWIGLAAVVVGAALGGASTAQPVVHHELSVTLDPDGHGLEATDAITLPAAWLAREKLELVFTLHGNLAVTALDETVEVSPVEPAPAAASPEGVPVRRWRLRPRDKANPLPNPVRLRYQGKVHHPLVEGMASARSFSQSPGLIDPRGVVLSGSTHWVPMFSGELVTFSLAVQLPVGWDAVSQGCDRILELTDDWCRVSWNAPEPTDEIYLIAARFTEYQRAAGDVQTYVFLRSPDPALAEQYLEATATYLELYERLIGPYPYGKFALVENFWETGFGMPSFTLLGPKIIRFPWILHSSYPHEILHNWWGNSVYVDWKTGNWCEGITAYMADHLIKENRGQGADYRRDTLKKYRNFVRDRRDFPLTDFRSRHSAATEAVGYGKALMMFHMLRGELGDAGFLEGLSAFYRDFRFKRASFQDLARTFTATAGRDLGWFFDQWVKRTGAPVLALGRVEVARVGRDHRVVVEVTQTQDEAPYRLLVPVAVTVDGQDRAEILEVPLLGRTGAGAVRVSGRPLAVQVDPAFDVFRRLDRREIPSSIGQVFGAERLVFVVPEGGEPALREALADAARTWARGLEGDVTIVSETELQALPADRAVWVLGAENPWRKAVLEGLSASGVRLTPAALALPDGSVPVKDHCLVLTAAHPGDPELAVGWIAADRADAIPGLVRKLPHYGKYSYVAFQGAEPTNVAKGQWPASGSPLVRDLRADMADGPALRLAALPAREPLGRPRPTVNAEQLMRHVRFLAAPELEGRGVGTAGLDRAADYLAKQFESLGLTPGGDDGTWFQTWQEPDGPGGQPATLRNVVGVLPGRRADWAAQSVVLGAHYDHLGRGWPEAREGAEGKIHPGADDNASGVAVLLETAAALKARGAPDRTVVFVAFSGEEWGLKGSRHYVSAMKRWPVKEARAMVNVDSVGRLGERKLLVLGAGSATEWVHVARGIGFTTGVESTAVADDPGASDQKSFLEAGVPAIQVFAGAHEDYHRPTDTADRVDAGGLAKAAPLRARSRDLPGRPGAAAHLPAGRPEEAGRAGSTGGRSSWRGRARFGTSRRQDSGPQGQPGDHAGFCVSWPGRARGSGDARLRGRGGRVQKGRRDPGPGREVREEPPGLRGSSTREEARRSGGDPGA